MSDSGRDATRWDSILRRKDQILNVRREMGRRSGPLGRAVGWVGNVLANPWFFAIFLAAHLAWVVLNLGLVPGVRPWDPLPFVLLATIASAEAPFIALLVLMAQSRAQHVDEIREEVQLQVDLYMERQTSAALRMLEAIQDELGIEPERDPDFEVLTEPLDPRRVMEEVRRGVEEEEEGPGTPDGGDSAGDGERGQSE